MSIRHDNCTGYIQLAFLLCVVFVCQNIHQQTQSNVKGDRKCACAHKVVKVCGNSGCKHDTSGKVPRHHSCGEDTTYISTIPGSLPSNATGSDQQGILILANYLFIQISRNAINMSGGIENCLEHRNTQFLKIVH